jgi:hypothetical protein
MASLPFVQAAQLTRGLVAGGTPWPAWTPRVGLTTLGYSLALACSLVSLLGPEHAVGTPPPRRSRRGTAPVRAG